MAVCRELEQGRAERRPSNSLRDVQRPVSVVADDPFVEESPQAANSRLLLTLNHTSGTACTECATTFERDCAVRHVL